MRGCVKLCLFSVAAALASATAEGGTMASGSKTGFGRDVTSTATPPWVGAGVSRAAYEDFQSFWETFEKQPRAGDFAIPRVIVWLNGAPGAGKGTNSSYVCDAFDVKEPPVVTSDLLASPAFVAAKESGKLVRDSAVTSLLFSTILSRRYAGGVVVDGYPRTAVQAECVKLLHEKILSMKQRSNFQVVIFDVSERVSVERQLGRGVQAQRHNDRVEKLGEGQLVEIRKTDKSSEAARHRFQVFVEETDGALKIFRGLFPCHRISAEGSFDQVRSNIYRTLKHI